MKLKKDFTVNDANHVVIDGIELAMNKKEFIYLQLIQNYNLDILLKIDDFCKKHDLTYYLAEGTLLGAMRHHGYIPWDDDIDICMPRDDYERFLKLAASEGIADDLVIDCDATNKTHWTILSQVELTKPVPYVKERIKDVALYNGPAVDIFPIDYVKKGYTKSLKIRDFMIQVFRRGMFIKTGMHKAEYYPNPIKRIFIFRGLSIYCKMTTLDRLRRRARYLMTKDNHKRRANYAVMFASLYTVDKEVFPKEWFGEPEIVDFEGYQFPVPAQSDKILNQIYGNYHAIPSIDMRKIKHYFIFDQELLAKIDDPEVLAIVEALKDEEDSTVKEKSSSTKSKLKQAMPNPKRFLRNCRTDVRTAYIDSLVKKPLEEHTVLFDAFTGLGILDSQRAIFKRMLERDDFKEFTYVWAIADESIVESNLDEFRPLANVIIIARKSTDYIKYLFTAKYVISNTSVPRYYARREGQVYLNTWHGVPTKAMGYERSGQKILSTRNIVHNYLNTTHIVSANDFTAEIMYKRAYKLNGVYEGKLLDSPMPRTDAIYNTDAEYITQKLNTEGISTDKKIIVYAPTWKGNSYKDFDASTTELKKAVHTLKQHIDTDEYNVFLRVHYFLYIAIQNDEELNAICVPFTIDTNELLSVTDILISDYSSIFFDFLGTKRPILFYVPDAEDYVDNRGLYIPLSDLPGPVCTTIVDVADKINHLDDVKRTYANKYETMYQWCSSKEDGHATDNVIDAVFLNKDIPVIDCHTDKTKLLIMADFAEEFAARNDLEKMLREIDYDYYDVTLLAGDPKSDSMKEALETIDSRVRILCQNSLPNVNYMTRKAVYKKLQKGHIKAEEALKKMDIKREYMRVLGDTHYDELILLQPTRGDTALWFMLAYYTKASTKSFIIASSGMKGVYKHQQYMEDFNIYHSISHYLTSKDND